jgi:putative Mg2+ transporter-C (MgtC) family protein
VTTAATIWFVTVLGLLYGGGNLYLGISGSVIAFIVLWALKLIERRLPREFRGTIHVSFVGDALSETTVHRHLSRGNLKIVHWSPVYDPPTTLAVLDCEVKWKASPARIPEMPVPVDQLRLLPGVASITWKE